MSDDEFEEFNSSKPVSKQDSQASPLEVESSATGYEPARLQSPSSQPETRNFPSCSSSAGENVATRKETNETSSEDEPERKPMLFSVFDLFDTLLRSLAMASGFLVALQDYCVHCGSEECYRGRKQQISIFTLEDFVIGRNLVWRFWGMVRQFCKNPSESYRLVITNRERSFLEELLRRVPDEIPAETVDMCHIPSPMFIGPLTELQDFFFGKLCNHPSASRLKMALAKMTHQHMIARYSVFRTFEPEASPEVCDSQSSSSASVNVMYESLIELEHSNPDEGRSESESGTLQVELKDRTPHESSCERQASEMELKSEKNTDDQCLS